MSMLPSHVFGGIEIENFASTALQEVSLARSFACGRHRLFVANICLCYQLPTGRRLLRSTALKPCL
jgi:hypothetical protein